MRHDKSNIVLENAWRLASVKGLYRIAARINMIEIGPSPLKTAHTDGIKIVFDPSFIEGLSTNDALFVASHEYYHIIYDHVRRCGEKKYNPKIYNIACDVIINDHLVNFIGLKRPTSKIGGVFRDNELFTGMPERCDTSEKVYKWLTENNITVSEENLMHDLQGNFLETEKQKTSSIEINVERLIEENDARNTGSSASKEIFDVIERDITETKNEWIDILTSLRIESGRLVERTISRTFSRPSRREETGSEILPSWRHHQSIPMVDVYIDVSGSMGENPITIFNGLRSILSRMSIYRTRFFTFNTAIVPTNIRDDKIKLGGGTDINLVLKKVKQDKSDLAILITDCEDTIHRKDIMDNTIIVSNNESFADFLTHDWEKVKRVVS